MKLRFLYLNLLLVTTAFASNAFGATCAKVMENQNAPISCPSGQVVTSIKFASYGSPQGSCGSYSVGSCNASSSKSVVQNLCLGKASCNVAASNSLFGDPCWGVGKSLAIEVTCGTPTTADSNWVRCATESGTCNFTGTRNVRYGVNGSYVTKSAVNGPVTCSNSSFGSDPAYGLTKYCDYSASTVVSPTTTTTTTTSTTTTLPPTTTTTMPAPSSSVGSNIVPPSPISIPSSTLAVPAVASGATVSLACGQVYRGTLDLNYKSNITINVSGTCGKPTIIPNAGQNGINAISASTIRIDGIKIQGAARGININNAKSVTINNVDILKSSDSGIYASGIVGMNISNSSISDSGNRGLNGGEWVVNGVVTNTTITRSGANGGSYNGIGIYFGDGHDNTIDHVSVSNSVYHGIVVLHNSYTYVKNSLVTSSCTGPDHDCGSIYTGARDKLPLNLQITGNAVSGSGGIGIYLDDFSNGVTVNGNSVTQTADGILLHNGFNNTIISNNVYSNRAQHLHFGQDVSGAIYGNKVTNNTFKSTNGERTINLESGDCRGFSIFDYNAYIGTSPAFARTWAGGSAPGIDYTYSSWKSYSGQDAHSTMNGVP